MTKNISKKIENLYLNNIVDCYYFQRNVISDKLYICTHIYNVI